MQNLNCKVEECLYNCNCGCEAVEVEIESCGNKVVNNCDNTACKTFQKK